MKDGLGFVMGVNIVIWAGIAFYLFVLDRRLKKLEEVKDTGGHFNEQPN